MIRPPDYMDRHYVSVLRIMAIPYTTVVDDLQFIRHGGIRADEVEGGIASEATGKI